METIKYNTPIEVTKSVHDVLMLRFAGVVAGRESEGKYYVKVLLMKYADMVGKFINKYS